MANAFPLVEIDPKSQAELRRRVPEFPESAFRIAVSRYLDRKRNPPPATKVIRDELDRIAERAIELAALLSGSSEELRDYLAASEVAHGARGLSARLPSDLRALMGIAEMARRDAEKLATPGRVVSARTELVSDLAANLQGLSLPVSAKAQDRLVLAFSIALSAAGETGLSDPAKTVKSALATIRAKQ